MFTCMGIYELYINMGCVMLDKLYGINTELGMSYCMDDEDFYREVLEEYINSNKVEELKKFFAEEDWYNYRIRIHSVKSTSLTIGAEELSAKALLIEGACKNEDISTIRAKHQECLDMYVKVLEIVKNAVE